MWNDALHFGFKWNSPSSIVWTSAGKLTKFRYPINCSAFSFGSSLDLISFKTSTLNATPVHSNEGKYIYIYLVQWLIYSWIYGSAFVLLYLLRFLYLVLVNIPLEYACKYFHSCWYCSMFKLKTILHMLSFSLSLPKEKQVEIYIICFSSLLVDFFFHMVFRFNPNSSHDTITTTLQILSLVTLHLLANISQAFSMSKQMICFSIYIIVKEMTKKNGPAKSVGKEHKRLRRLRQLLTSSEI